MWSGVLQPSPDRRCSLESAAALLAIAFMFTGCTNGVTDLKGPMGTGDLMLLVDSLAIVVPAIIATIGFAGIVKLCWRQVERESCHDQILCY